MYATRICPCGSCLDTERNAVLNDPAVREKLRLVGIDATPDSASEFGSEIKRALARYGRIATSASIRIASSQAR